MEGGGEDTQCGEKYKCTTKNIHKCKKNFKYIKRRTTKTAGGGSRK